MSATAAEGNGHIEPWASDERLNDPVLLGTMNLANKLIQGVSTLAEVLPQDESIPKMWEAVKDLNPESIKELQTALKDM